MPRPGEATIPFAKMRRADHVIDVADRRRVRRRRGCPRQGGRRAGRSGSSAIDPVNGVERQMRVASPPRCDRSLHAYPLGVPHVRLLHLVAAKLDLDIGEVWRTRQRQLAQTSSMVSPDMRSASSTASRTACSRGHVGDVAALPPARDGGCRAPTAAPSSSQRAGQRPDLRGPMSSAAIGVDQPVRPHVGQPSTV